MPGKNQPYYHDSIDKICDAYHQAKSKGTGSDMNEIAAAAAAGRVETLLIEAALQIPGKITSDTGTIEKGVK
jgi:hypothetical protein